MNAEKSSNRKVLTLLGERIFNYISYIALFVLTLAAYFVFQLSDYYSESIETGKQWNSFSRQLDLTAGYLQQLKQPIEDVRKNHSWHTEKIQAELAGTALKRHLDNMISEMPTTIIKNKPEIENLLKQFRNDHTKLVESAMDVFSSIQKNNLKESNEHEIIFNSQYMILDKQLRQIESENQISYERFLTLQIESFNHLIFKTFSFLVVLLGLVIMSIYLGRNIRQNRNNLTYQLSNKNKDLSERSSNLQRLFESAPVGIYQTDKNGDCIFVNKKWCEIAGITQEQAMGGGWYLAICPEDRDRLSTEWKNFVDGQASFNSTYRFQSPDGKITIVQGEAIPIRDPNTNEITNYIGIVLDITAEKNLVQTLSFYKHAVDNSIIVSVADLKGNITYVNDAFCEISQYSRDEIIGRNHRFLNSAYHPKEMWADLWRTISKGQIWKGQIRNKRKDGTFYWVDATMIPNVDANGKVTQYYSIRRDITEYKKIESTLESRTSNLTAIMDNSNYSIIATDTQGIIQTFNKSAERILGYSASEMIGKESPAKFHDMNEVVKHAKKLSIELKQEVAIGFETFVAKSKKGIADENEWTYIAKDGTRIPVQLSVTAIRNQTNEITGYLGIATDLTKQKEKDTQFLNLVQNLPAAVYRTEVNNFWSFEFVSDAIKSITGFESIDLLKNSKISFASIIHTEDLEYVRRSVIAAVENGLPYLIEYRIINKSGEVRWVFEKGSSQLVHGSTSDKYLDGAIFDITHMKSTELELKSQKSFIEKITNAIPSIIYVSAVHEDKIVYSNRNLFEFLGYSHHQEQKNHIEFFKKIIHPDDAHLLNGRRQQWLTSKLDILDSKEFRVKHHNGHYLWLRDKTLVFRRDENGLPLEIIGILDDITISKKLQQDLEDEKLRAVHSSKMASLGEMAGGVSHEINNPLSIIEGNAAKIIRVLEKETLDIEELKKAAGKIETTTERIAKIIRGLRSFSRDGAKDPFIPTTIQSLIDETLSFCEARLTNHRIQLKINPFDPELKIDCRGVQLSQVILNLINNSSDAIQSLSNPWIQLNVQDLGASIEISVTDSGKGIPTEVAEKIMQPFFTTKGIGKGTGLGLSINKGIIESHQGKFYLDTDCPNTRFVIELPKKHHFSLKKTG